MIKKQIKELAEKACPPDLNFRRECADFTCGAIKSFKEGFLAGYEAPRAEIDRLHKVIAKELTENDEIGCEYTYVNALKREIEKRDRMIEVMREALDRIYSEANYMRTIKIQTVAHEALAQAKRIEEGEER